MFYVLWYERIFAIYLKPIQLAPNKESTNKLTAKILGLPLKYGEPQGPPEGWNSSRLHHLWNKSWSSISEENRFWICWRKSSNKFTFHWAPYHHSSLLVSWCSSNVFCQSELSLLATLIKKYWIKMKSYNIHAVDTERIQKRAVQLCYVFPLFIHQVF